MDPIALITAFHEAAARDLLIYMFLIFALIAGAVCAAGLRRGLGLIAFATALLVLGAALALAAYGYRESVPGRIATDIASYRADAVASSKDFTERYGPSQAGERFARLAAVWSVLIVGSGLVMTIWRRPLVRGICSAIVLLSAITLGLDLFAYQRDLDFAGEWVGR